MALAAASAGGVSRLLKRDATNAAAGLASGLFSTPKAGAGSAPPSLSPSPTSRRTDGSNVTPTICPSSTQINRNPIIAIATVASSSRHYTTTSSYLLSLPASTITKSHTLRAPYTSLYPQSLKSLHRVRPVLSSHAHAIRHFAQSHHYNKNTLRTSIHTDDHLINITIDSKMSSENTEAQPAQVGILERVTDALKAVGIVSDSNPESSQTEDNKKSKEGSTTPEIRTDEKFVGSVDQGTTSSRFIIFNDQGMPVASHQIEFENIYPQSGWHEHDPKELVSSVLKCIDGAVKKFTDKGYNVDQIQSVGITNQRETTICWDKHTGEPLNNAVVWPDTRTTSLVRELREREGSDKLMDLCGLPISTYPSSVKLLWMLDNVDAIKKAYEEERLAFGTVDSWLVYNLNGGKEANIHVTDSTNASRTMFMNIHKLEYDDELLKFFNLDRKKITLPKIVRSSEKEAFGKITTGALKGVRITGCLGDQSAALVGQCAFKKGEAKNTYGTGCFLLYNVGQKPVISDNGLLATVGYHFGDTPIYALEGSIAVAGSGVKFLQKNMGFIESSSEIEKLAKTVPDNGGVVFVTAFSGLFAPYWIDDAKGTIFGITAHTQRGHIARATLEATCYQTNAILLAMREDSDTPLKALAVDGGMSDSDLCMQTQADLIGLPVERPAMRETTALGAAIAAGLAVDMWKGTEDLESWRGRGNDVFKPKIGVKKSEQMFRRWERAVEMSKGWMASEEEQRSWMEEADDEAIEEGDAEDTPGFKESARRSTVDWRKERESFSALRAEREFRDRLAKQERSQRRASRLSPDRADVPVEKLKAVDTSAIM